ncbi:MAG: hypothetical protein KC636_22570 [Myxococcales bacterium]|nr:hypothetical protein [Myxococcales bacterium]
MPTDRRLLLIIGPALAFAATCGGDEPEPELDPGAIVRVSAVSQVGVLLEEFPESARERIAGELVGRSPEWWMERARWQLRLTYIRLIYRKYYFDEAEQAQRNALPLPPEEHWKIILDADGPQRRVVDGHDMVAIGYHFESTLLTDVASPGVSEPALDVIGGVWDEPFVFPVDPTLLFQRTGYACMSEDEFPPESVDAEEAYRFYDDTCEVEAPGENACHYTEPLPQESCIDAVSRVIGGVGVDLHFERLEWDPALADEVRSGELTREDAPDLKVLTTGEGLNDNRVLYKYIPEDHCAVVEGCVGGSGWRRLLVFDSHDHNVGGEPLHIGEVDYFVEGLGGELIDRNVYSYSACHDHYHFQYYGDFSFSAEGASQVQKNGFCLESTDRLSNNESSPLHTDYGCHFQGVSPGWGDLYGSSLTCNWVDITEVDTSTGPLTGDLAFRSNPDGFLCEGTLQTDESGAQLWEESEFMTEVGDPVFRPLCEQAPGTEANDVGQVEVTLPQRGGFVTAPCRTEHDLGPLRNCDFEEQPALSVCAPGEAVSLTCSLAGDAAPQVVRICRTSQVLGGGVDCSHVDALANVVVEGDATEVSFTCPAALDAEEPGGEYGVYSAPVWSGDARGDVTCSS